MFNKNSVSEQKIADKLDSLRAVPPRNPEAMHQRRAAFLTEVQAAAQAVSPAPKRRLLGWINPLNQKEMKPMFSSIVAIIVAISLALGGAGVTVAAAQTALPDEALYGIKTLSEDVWLALNGDEAQMALSFEFIQRRIEEMAALGLDGKEVPEGVAARLETQLENAFRIAAEQQDAVMLQTLEQLRTRLQDQDALCEQLQEQNQNQSLVKVQEMIQERLRLVENGIKDPEAFRTQVGEGLNRPEEMLEPGEGGAGEPQEPGAGIGEPGFGEGEEQGEPGAGTGEPGYGPGEAQSTPDETTGEPGSGPAEPQEPGTGTGEPQQTPAGPQATPGSGSGEPGGNPTSPGTKP